MLTLNRVHKVFLGDNLSAMTTIETDSSTEKAQSVIKEMTAPEEEKKREELTFDEETQDAISQKIEEKTNDRRKYSDWPVRDIKEPHNNDVLYGRGGKFNTLANDY